MSSIQQDLDQLSRKRNLEGENIRLNSSRPPLMGKCLPANKTVIGRPCLSNPCINILFCSISFWISDADMKPFGTDVLLHFRYLRNIAQALPMSRSRARRNLLIIKSSTSCRSNLTRFHKISDLIVVWERCS